MVGTQARADAGRSRPSSRRHHVRRVAASVIAVVALVMLTATACSNPDRSAGGTVFRIGETQAIDSLNPFVAEETISNTVFSMIYPSLVQINPANQYIPNFARSWEVSPNGKTWTFHTQSEAKWSDGTPLTAADAAWTLSTIVKFQNGPTANQGGFVAHLVSATAPNATTLVMQYTQPVANVLNQLAFVVILPQHIWATYATGAGKALTTFANAVPIVSGGPFSLTKYTPKQSALLERNASFYGPKPHVGAVGLQFFGTDDAMITALENGKLDGVPGVAPTSVATLKSKHLVVESSPNSGFDDLTINNNPLQDASHRELVNPLLREAFDHAIDRPRIVQTSLLGHAELGSSIIPPVEGVWYNKQIQPTQFDLTKANQLLDQAGYVMGSDHIRVAGGHKMSYTVIMPADTAGYGQRSFKIIASDFAKIGVRLNPQNLDNSAAYSAISANKYASFEMAMWGWSLGGVDPDDMLSYLTCGQWGTAGDSGFCSKDWDKLYEQQAVTLDKAKRQAIVYQMQEIAAQKRIYLVIDYPDVVSAHSEGWTDLPLNDGSWMNALSLESVRRSG